MAEWDILQFAIDTAIRIKDWAWWYILHKVAPTRLPALSDWPPRWYRDTYQWWTWQNDLDGHGRPKGDFWEHYGNAIWHYFLLKIRERWEEAIDLAEEAINTLLGVVGHGFVKFSEWVDNIYVRVGEGMTLWALTLVEGVDKLFNLLPWLIAIGDKTWKEVFDSVRDEAVDLVATVYQVALDAATTAKEWVDDAGEAIKTWYNTVSAWVLDWAQNAKVRVVGLLGATWRWLEALKADPYGVISIILGAKWTSLVSWVDGPLTFYYNLWGSHWEDIRNFWADPLGWLYDKAEDELIRRW